MAGALFGILRGILNSAQFYFARVGFLKKQINGAVSQKEAIKIQHRKNGHRDHQKKISKAEPHAEHRNVCGGRTAQKRREDQFSVAFSHSFVSRLIFVPLGFDQAERIKIYR